MTGDLTSNTSDRKGGGRGDMGWRRVSVACSGGPREKTCLLGGIRWRGGNIENRDDLLRARLAHAEKSHSPPPMQFCVRVGHRPPRPNPVRQSYATAAFNVKGNSTSATHRCSFSPTLSILLYK